MQTPVVIALGFFDGVHLGHGALLKRTRQRASELRCPAVVLSFDRHPSALITGKSVALINTASDRAWLMKALYGIDQVLLAPFDEAMMQMDWEDFVRQYLVGTLHACHVVCGHDYRFGYQGRGTPEKLQALCSQLGLGCDIIGQVQLSGVTVSSTFIRTLLSKGDVETAAAFLGHPHLLTGCVIHGNHVGATLGFPTANLALPQGLISPAGGVYATKVAAGESSYYAVTNVGTHPTVGRACQTLVESSLLQFSGDLYGQQIRVEFCRYLRPEKTFSSLAALRAAIGRDVQSVKDYFGLPAI